MKPIRWFDIWAGGRRVEIVFSTPKHCVALRRGRTSLLGRCVYEDDRIILNALASNHVTEETLIHELLHLSLENLETDEDTEERIVEWADSRLAWSLRQIGFRLPPIPEGVERLRERARGRKGRT